MSRLWSQGGDSSVQTPFCILTNLPVCWNQSNSTVGKVFTLHVAKLSSILASRVVN